ncbi:sucrose-specific PTS transporter subunit IIBC [Periweissella ghanensis]|uniref:protein-N(pi)-phosphohistidine--sucrose phosphotransferase n=1 Tax=Periweissella ghanensis TaxID=467997 RepID=A0ABN8BM07_9LACO|nr:sucrose-specific PTS transporter subunit IIBC [Periweissella ghanensis]MCM0601177.1 PTS transporter subunit EIIC [Periweissella ghanensis]CAH0417974.1 hypothetical protein WGH24286_00390 [Periweissella ghanensis]
MKHAEVAQRIIAALGPNNVITAAHCATRLRLIVKDRDIIDQTALDNDPDLKGTFDSNGQFQIIVGPGDVNKVYDEFIKQTGVKTATPEELKEIAAQQGAKQNPLMAIIKVLSDIFVPLIPAMTAGGLLMALNNILTGSNLFGAKSLVQMYPQIADIAAMVNLMASAPFAFLPILIGFTATKRFGGSEILGATAGMMLVMPSLVNGYNVAEAVAAGKMPFWHILGLDVAQAGYQGQVLPVIGVAFILATLEKFFHKRLKGAIDFTFTPMLSIIITGFLTFIVVGPILRTVSTGITDGLVALYNSLGFIGMGIFGTFYSAIVVTGLHQSFPAIETTLLADISKTGGDFIFPIAAVSNVAQGAATFAIFFLAKNNEKVRALASSAGASAMLGITEPAMFGVNLKYKFPFFIALGSAGIAGLVIGLFHVLSASLGPAGVIGFIAIPANKWIGFFISIAISFTLAFTFTYLYGKKKFALATVNVPTASPATATSTNVTATENASYTPSETDLLVTAPVSGTTTELKDVNDPVFASGAMGAGIAIDSSNGHVTAPVTGTISVAYPTAHAYGLVSDDGVEVLIHIGIDTVNLNGTGFTSQVTQGQRVKQGDVLGSFDKQVITDAGLDSHVMVIITNSANYTAIKTTITGTVKVNETLLACVKKGV